jgi:hypothetical protein
MVVTDKFNQLMGSVERVGDTTVQTLFFVFMMLPIYPQSSYAVVKRKGEKQVMEMKRNGRSVAAGYLRWWPGGLGLTGIILGGSALFYMNDEDLYVAEIVTGVSAFLLLFAGIMFLVTRGALTPHEKAQRMVYSEFAGLPVDVAKLVDPWSLRDNIKRFLSDKAEAMGATRGQPHGFGFNHWYAIALDQRMNDVGFLRGALTVARLLTENPDEHDAELGVPPQNYAQIHATIWQKLCALDPRTAQAS